MTVTERVKLCRSGLEPLLVARLKSGWFCLSEVQPLGRLAYGVLYHDALPPGLNALDRASQAQWGADTALCGEALINVLHAARANYETWGNVDPSLHTHITARFLDESPELGAAPPRQAYDWSKGIVLDLKDPKLAQTILALREYIESRS
jgi:hypothetical protein